MPLAPGRGRAGVVDAPVAKAAVVTAAVSPGPSPVAKAAVVGAAVSPGPSPVAKAAVVTAAVTPGRRAASSRPPAIPDDPGTGWRSAPRPGPDRPG